jgi:hypothetical protein
VNVLVDVLNDGVVVLLHIVVVELNGTIQAAIALIPTAKTVTPSSREKGGKANLARPGIECRSIMA